MRPNSPSSHPSRSAFTLIELLVVISIIAILMGLLFPAASSVLDNARRATAKNDVVQIATAITAFETEYGKLPPVSGTVDQTLVDILMPSTASPSTENPRKIVFLEVPSIKAAGKGKSGQVNQGGPYLDPWGAAYQIAVDDNYDHTIPTAGVSPGPIGTNLRKKVAVWNNPNSHTDNPNDGKKKRRAVASWD